MINDYFTAIKKLIQGERTRGERKLADERLADIRNYLDVNNSLRILDLANGYLRPQYLLLQADGHKVFGIDWVNRSKQDIKDFGYGLARHFYSWHISGRKKNKENRLVCGDVGRLPFKKDYFDLVTSIAAFEHFLDVPSVVSELQRVMRPGAIAYIRIHLFTCPSGAHNLKLMEIPIQSIPKGIDPWDHLRKRNLPINVPLNEWRVDQYLQEFSRNFEILKSYCAMKEGEHLLTKDLEKELAFFTRDELTCGAYVILARRKNHRQIFNE